MIWKYLPGACSINPRRLNLSLFQNSDTSSRHAASCSDWQETSGNQNGESIPHQTQMPTPESWTMKNLWWTCNYVSILFYFPHVQVDGASMPFFIAIYSLWL